MQDWVKTVDGSKLEVDFEEFGEDEKWYEPFVKSKGKRRVQ